MKRRDAEALLARYQRRLALIKKQRVMLTELQAENTRRDDLLPIDKMGYDGNHNSLIHIWSETQWLNEEIYRLEKLLTR